MAERVSLRRHDPVCIRAGAGWSLSFKTVVCLFAALLTGSGSAFPANATVASPKPGLEADATAFGILTFDGVRPTTPIVRTLKGLGLEVQRMERLPMAFVRGSTLAIDRAVDRGYAAAFYPEQRMDLASGESNGTIGVGELHRSGLTGKGMTVAVIDSGVDATHPDLADHVPHNVKFVGPEYAYLPSDTPPGRLVVPVDEGPYSDTDVNGHGTMVAGIIAADATTRPEQIGVAPDAEVIGYSAGDVTMTMAVASMDHVLDNPDWGIDVVNNSWGNVWGPFDPEHPINVASKALTDAGISVVFVAGNNGDDETPMTMSPFAAAPWVIGAAATDVEGRRADFSSNGLIYDNSLSRSLSEGHVRFKGDRLGIYHPSVAAPGHLIETSCTAGPNPYAGPLTDIACEPGGTGVSSGTSFAAPHIAGVIALLEQRRDALKPATIKKVLEATARPTTPASPFWQTGYGLIDAPSAVALIEKPDWKPRLERLHEAAARRILKSREWKVPVSEHWSWELPVATVQGIPDTRELSLRVQRGIKAINLSVADANSIYFLREGHYRVTVMDAAGTVIGQTTPTGLFGSSLFIDLRSQKVAFGEWTLLVEGTAVWEQQFTPLEVSVVAALLK